MTMRSDSGAIHVAHVLETLQSGGAEVAVRALAPRLVALGIRTTLVSIYANRLTPGERASLEAGGVGLMTIGRRGRSDVAFFGRLVAGLRTLRPTIVHGHVHAGKYAGRAAAILARVPAILYTAHGESRLDGSDAYSPLERAANALLNPRTTRFITFTSAQQRDFARAERVALERITVLPNGVPAPIPVDRAATRAMLGLPSDATALYMPARLAAVKGHAVAIDALAALGEEGARCHLVFAGDGPDGPALRALACERGLEARTHWLGYRSDAASLGSAMDRFLLPSLQERMPLALGEAMLSSLAVVTAPWAGSDDFIREGETGYVALDGTPEAFAEALRRADGDPARPEVVERARRRATERFDVAAWARAHAALYRALA